MNEDLLKIFVRETYIYTGPYYFQLVGTDAETILSTAQGTFNLIYSSPTEIYERRLINTETSIIVVVFKKINEEELGCKTVVRAAELVGNRQLFKVKYCSIY